MIIELFSFIEHILLYGLMFAVSLYFVNKADKSYRKHGFVLNSLIALLIPCLFAAFRAETVGTDVLQYAKPYYLGALAYDSLVSYLVQGSAEVGYEIFVYYVTRIFGNFSAVLFFTEALVIVPVYIVALKNRKKWPMWLTMSTFFSIFYIASFNFMRQSIAAALLLLAYFELIEKKWIKVILLILIAQSFHNTAVIGVVVILFGTWLYKIKNKRMRQILFFVSCTILVGIFLNWQEIVYWAVDTVGILPPRFVTYINIFSGKQNQDSYYFILTKSNYAEMLFRWLCYLVPLFLTKKKYAKDNFFNTANIVTLMSVVVYTVLFVLFHTSYAVRVTWYMEYFFIIWIPMSYSKIRNGSNKHGVISINTFVMCLLLVMYWLFGFMILGWHGTLPFAFSF